MYMIAYIKKLFTRGHDLIIGIQREEMRLLKEENERLRQDIKEVVSDIDFCIKRIEGMCPPEHLHRFEQIRRRTYG